MSGDRSDALRALVGPQGPSSAAARETWAGLDERSRSALRRAATDPVAASSVDAEAHRVVVAELATRRAERRPADLFGPVLTGLLVLSTLWGFGRAVFPADAGWWLVAGLLGLAATVVVGRRRVVLRRRGAAAVRRALDERDRRPSGRGP